MSSWELSGKLALRDGDTADSGKIRWQQHQDATRMTVSGPFGVAATNIVSDGQTVMVTRDDTRYTYNAQDMDTKRGWVLPINALAYWVKGMPAPQLRVQEMHTEGGELKQLQQGDWHLSYTSYQQFGNHNLPTKMEIQKDNVWGRLVIKTWRPTLGDE